MQSNFVASFNIYFLIVLLCVTAVTANLVKPFTSSARPATIEKRYRPFLPVDSPTEQLTHSLRNCGGSIQFTEFYLISSPDTLSAYLFTENAVTLGNATVTLSYQQDPKILLLPMDDNTLHIVDIPCGKGNSGNEKWKCEVAIGSPTTFLFSYNKNADTDDSLGKLYQATHNDIFAKFYLHDNFNTDLTGCAVIPIGNADWPSSVSGNVTNVINIPFIVGAIIVLAVGVVQQITAMQAQLTKALAKKKVTKRQKKEESAEDETAKDGAELGREPAKQVPLSAQIPSVYDIFRAAQFVVSNALLSLFCLPPLFRDISVKLAWFSGVPSSGFNGTLSKIADDKIRGGICNTLVNGCSVNVENLTMSTFCRPQLKPLSSGFTSFGEMLNIPSYNMFFMVFIIFCIALACAVGAVLILVLVSRLLKHWWGKWPILEKCWNNIPLLFIGGALRVVLLFNSPLTLFAVYQLTLHFDCWFLRFLAALCIAFFTFGITGFCTFRIMRDMYFNPDAFKTPVHEFVYGAFYTQYTDDEGKDPKKTRIWFFIFTTAYDMVRAIGIGAARVSGTAQTIYLIVIETLFFLSLLLFKPYMTWLMNALNIFISFLRIAVMVLLFPGLSKCTTSVFKYVALGFEGIISLLLFVVIVIKVAKALGKYCCSSKKDTDATEDDDTAEIESDSI
ncbi:4828_t:CDS:2 [Paraglomus occultum]|uniref:4828_t:CDS:1 n=1 Tax=Paraglomus occultum TaxID=144539 RepID=A0A9N8WG53_9GLOM|nr:4828_t:CDS:2 [Paraglomus occultum]